MTTALTGLIEEGKILLIVDYSGYYEDVDGLYVVLKPIDMESVKYAIIPTLPEWESGLPHGEVIKYLVRNQYIRPMTYIKLGLDTNCRSSTALDVYEVTETTSRVE